jgi:AAHS family benzoate transporter-like MFS transporter
MLAALMGKSLIETYGWQSVFLAAGVPLLTIQVVLKLMPESLPFLIQRDRVDTLKKVLGQMEPNYQAQVDDTFDLPPAGKGSSAPISMLFRDGRGFSTVMLWVAFFMCLFMVYALSSWLAKLMAGAGYSLGSALTFVLVLNFGAIAGAIGGGWMADRFNIKYVLVGMYALAAVSITLLGYKMPTEALFCVVALAGASTIGTQIVTYAYAGQFYPATVRGTGIGWASGVGRSGAILAPIVIGILVSMSLPLQKNFLAMAIPAVIAVIAVLLIDHKRSASQLRAGIPSMPGRPVDSPRMPVRHRQS